MLVAVGWGLCRCAPSEETLTRDVVIVRDSATLDAANPALDSSLDATSDAGAQPRDSSPTDSRAVDATMVDQGMVDSQPMCSGGRMLCGAECVDINTSTMHCGICEVPCDPVGTTRVQCVAGACDITCDRLHGNCDSNNYNGCETPFEDDPMNCGACGNQCFRTQNYCRGRCVEMPCD